MTTTTTKPTEAPEMPIADRLEHCAKFTGLDAVRELLVEAAQAVRKRDAVIRLLEGEVAQAPQAEVTDEQIAPEAMSANEIDRFISQNFDQSKIYDSHLHYFAHALNQARDSQWLARLSAQPAPSGEPVAWMVMNGICKYQLFAAKALADALCTEMQKRHDLSGSLAAFHVQPLYAAPQAPSVPDWEACKAISETPEVDEALRLFSEGEATEDQAVCIVQAVLAAAKQGGV